MTAAGPVEGLVPGELLADRYRLLRPLGSGARKSVHLAHDAWLERDVAVCALQVASAEEAARLRREAALLARVGHHPCVVAVHDLLEVRGAPVMICQHLAGGSLRERLRSGPVPVDTAVGIAVDLASALARAHACGVVHRDVKPANVWLDGQGRAVLGDFGLAVGPELGEQPFDLLVGTAAYVSPEQLLGDRCDGRSDLYALGAVLYELLTGRPPHVDGSQLGVVARVLQDDPVPPSALRPEVPADLDELVLRLLAKDPAQRPESAEQVREALVRRSTVGGPGPLPRQGFVGRTAELAELQAALDEAAAGRGGLTLLLGDAGVGKTRTALELAHRAAGAGWTVLTGRCHEDEVAPAFWPVTQVLRGAVAALPEAHRQALPPVLSALLPELGSDSGPALAEAERFRLFEAVTRVLADLAAATPVLVLLDDVHWMDRGSAALTAFATRELGTARIAVVASARETDDADVLDGLLRRSTRTVRLGGLSSADTARYVESALGVAPDPWLLRDLHERTDGNPFYVAELVRLLQAEQRITAEGGLTLGGGELVPGSVRDVLQRRLRHVSADCAALLRTLSVVGRESAVPVLAQVHGCAPERALDLLEEATAARLVVPVGDTARFRFAHALVREALYSELPVRERTAVHRALVTVLAEAHAHDLDARAGELAHHAVRAAFDGDTTAAVVWSVRAARAASRTAAHEAAVLHYGRALDLARGDEPDVPPYGELLLELGEAQRRLGQTGEAQLTFLHAADDALARGDAELLARAALGYGLGLGGFGFVEHADGVLLGLLEEAVAVLGTQDSPLRMRVLARLSTELYFTPFRSRRLLLSEQALDMARRLDDPAGELVALYSRTLALLGPDRLDERRGTAARVVWMATTLADPEMAFRGHHLSLMVALETGSLDLAREHVRACRRIADVHRQPAHAWHAEAFEAMLALADGRHEDGLHLAHRAVATGRRGSPDMAMVMHGAQLLVVHWAQGRLAEVVDGARHFADRYPHAPAWRAALAFCLTELGRLDEAAVELERLAGRDFVDLPEDGNYLTTAVLLAHTAARLGDVGRSRLLERKLRPYADRSVVISAGAVAFTSVRLALGAVRGVVGDLDGAVHDVEVAHERHLASLPACAVWSGEELARLLLTRAGSGDRARARQVAQDALEQARALGMPAHAERLDALVREAGGAGEEPAAQRTREGAVTVLLSDVAGSTVLTESLGERAVHLLLAEHRRAVEALAAQEGGLVVKVLGDAVLAALPSPDAALRCAARLQQRYECGPPTPVRLRIGVHTGEVLRSGDSMYGRTMILAFRVADLARAGEVLVTAPARDGACTGLDFDEPELVRLKGIADPQPVSRLRWRPV